MNNIPLIVIVGETASGKSGLAMELAEKFDGEIISADSMAVYKNFDIGSAKPSSNDRAKIKHYLVDVADPASGFNVAKYMALANEAITQINSCGKIPIMVGGSGLYVDSVLFGFGFRPDVNLLDLRKIPASSELFRSAKTNFSVVDVPSGTSPPDKIGFNSFESSSDRDEVLRKSSLKLRTELNNLDKHQLMIRAKELGLSTEGVDIANKRRLIRLIETGGKKPIKKPIRQNTLVIGMSIERDQLHKNISDRVDKMLISGLKEEVRGLAEKYGWDIEAMRGVGYREFKKYFDGVASLSEVREEIILDTRHLAKKQRTWFRRNNSIHWVAEQREAVDLVTTFLNNYRR